MLSLTPWPTQCFSAFTVKLLFKINVSLCRSFFNHKLNFLIDLRLLRASVSSGVSSGSLCLSRYHPFHPSCQIYWHKVVHIFPYFPCKLCRVCSDPTALVSDRKFVSSLFFFLINLPIDASVLLLFSKNPFSVALISLLLTVF